MGRRKISIKPIADDRNRQTTLKKRKEGLMKKAYELSVLCNCEIAMIIFDANGKHYQYGSHKINETLMRLAKAGPPTENHTNDSLAERIEQKEHRLQNSRAQASSDADTPAPEPVEEEPPVLRKTLEFTPRTMDNLKQLDKEFATMIQHMRNDPEKGSNSNSAGSTFAAPTQQTRSASAKENRLSQRKPPGLEVMIPARGAPGQQPPAPGMQTAKGSQLQFPPGTKPRAVTSSAAANVLSPSLGVGVLPTPSFTGNLPASLLAFQPTSPWPITPSNLNASLNWGVTSPAVLHTGAAGDLHVSSSFQQAQQQVQQQQAVAQMQAAQLMQQREVSAAAALAQVGSGANDDHDDGTSSDDDGDELDDYADTKSGSKRKAAALMANSPTGSPKHQRTAR